MECKRTAEFAHRESTYYESGEAFNGEVGAGGGQKRGGERSMSKFTVLSRNDLGNVSTDHHCYRPSFFT